MHVTPTGQSEYCGSAEVLRYGRDLDTKNTVGVWFHDGLHKYDEPAWAMDTDVEFKISVSVDTLLVTDRATKTVYAIDRDRFTDETEHVDGDEQYVAKAGDEFVDAVGDPNDVLGGSLYIESGNEINEGYHKRKNEA